MMPKPSGLAAAIAGLQWTTPAGAAPATSPIADLHHASARLIKQNSFRTIFRLQVAGHDLHLKQCRPHGIRAWLREWLRPPKALLEYRNLLRLRACGIPTLEPLGAGTIRNYGPGPSALLTRTVPGATTLSKFLESDLQRCGQAEQAQRRHALAAALGELLARLWSARICHDDLHPGNILLSWDDAKPQLYLLDVHDIRFDASPTALRNSLVLLNRWFALRASRTDRLRCWQSFIESIHTDDRPDPREIEEATLKSNMRLWRSRFDRSCGHNRHFQRLAFAGWRGFALRDVNIDELGSLLSNPHDALARGRILKHSRSSTVALIAIRLGGLDRSVVLKHFRRCSLGQRMRALFRPTACVRSWQNGQAFCDTMLATPRPIAVWQNVRFGLPGEGFLLQEYAPGVDLHAALDQCNCPKLRYRLIDAAARFIRLMHERGWSHRDLKAANFLVSWTADCPNITLIDLVGAHRNANVSAKRRIRDLARLNASFLRDPRISASDRLRFLRTYHNWGLHGKTAWKTWWRQIAQLTQAKAEQNKRRRRVLR